MVCERVYRGAGEGVGCVRRMCGRGYRKGVWGGCVVVCGREGGDGGV